MTESSRQVKVATDPVCGMKVSLNSEHHYVYGDETYLFCSVRCLDKFKAAPQQYLKNQHPAEKQRHQHHESPKTDKGREIQAKLPLTYICPMHPRVRQQEPGNCPICGMALEPEQPQTTATQTQY